MDILRYEHGEGDFWQRLGPFFASMQVQRELGLPMRSGESFTWWLAEESGTVLGFNAAERQKNGVVLLRHAWTRPDWREEGVYTALFDRRLADLKKDGHSRFRTTTSEPALHVIEDRGFEKKRERGQYSVLELTLDD
jgi:N-acetylglutamate synthase-like GNAT family acetyltransferase